MSSDILVKLNDFDMLFENGQVGPVSFSEVQYLLEQALVLGRVAAQGHAANQGILPHILEVKLSRSHVKFPAQAG